MIKIQIKLNFIWIFEYLDNNDLKTDDILLK